MYFAKTNRVSPTKNPPKAVSTRGSPIGVTSVNINMNTFQQISAQFYLVFAFAQILPKNKSIVAVVKKSTITVCPNTDDPTLNVP